MKTKHKFPNGFYSWSETHYGVVEEITKQWLDPDNIAEIIEQTQEREGHKGLWELAIKLTDEFELKFKGEKWEEKDYYDEIDAFLKEKLVPQVN